MPRLTLGAAAIVAIAMGCGRPEENTVIVPMMSPPTTGTPIDRETPAKLETATFAVG